MSKYIKLEDAIYVDCTLIDEVECDDCPFWNEERAVCRMTERLKSLPTIEVSEDCISREWLISFIDAGHLRNPNEKCYSENDVVELIKNAPSVVPKQVTGKLEDELNASVTQDSVKEQDEKSK